MEQAVYQLYQLTYVHALAAVRLRDDDHLRRLCADVAARDGVESVACMLALGDAERGHGQRSRADLLVAVWPHLPRR